LSTEDYLYLNCGTQNSLGDNTFCGPYTTWKHLYYDYDPTLANLNERLLGSECAMWSEFEEIATIE